MNRLLDQHHDAIVNLCQRYRVQRLELFGSAARADFQPERSDIDFLVEFEQLRRGEHADAYFGLLESLELLLSRNIDLVMTRAVRNPYFLQAINKTRTLIYAA